MSHILYNYPHFAQSDANRIRANFPSELLDLPNWVAWAWIECRDKPKPTKKPINPQTGQGAKSNDPRTWASFDQSIRFALGHKIQGGVGFMFAPPYVGIDFDHCIEEGAIDAQRLSEVDRLNSYTELSPSKTGLHIICKGSLPPGRRKGRAVEVYEVGRFFTVTGERLTGYNDVRDCPNVLRELHAQWFPAVQRICPKVRSVKKSVKLRDDQIWIRMFASKNGERWRRLFKGEWKDYYRTQSEADIAFVGALVFWTGLDSERVDTLFRKSGLYRRKWDDVHDSLGRTYGEMTIAEASANMCPEDCYHARKPRLS